MLHRTFSERPTAAGTAALAINCVSCEYFEYTAWCTQKGSKDITSPATPLPANAADYTAFAAALATDASIDLTVPPLSETGNWTDRTDYAACQALADTARGEEIELIRYRSVRDPAGGANLAVLTCAVFAQRAPIDRQTWKIQVGRHGVQALCDFPRQSLEFVRAGFAADPRLG